MQVSPRIHALPLPFSIPVGPGQTIQRLVYVYVLLGQSETWLVDSGVAGSEVAIADCLAGLGRGLESISTLVLTHSHPDHIGAASAIQQTTGCCVLVHEAERAWVEDVELQQRQRPVPGFSTLVGGPARVTGTFVDGDKLEIDEGLVLDVIHSPGHSPGSASFRIEVEGGLITGDALISPGDFPIYDDAGLTAASIKRLANIPGVERLLSSWEEPRLGDNIPGRFQASLRYLEGISEVVRKVARGSGRIQPMELCEAVVRELGLPPAAVNPLVAKAVMSHLRSESA